MTSKPAQPTPAEVRGARIAAGMTQAQAGARFGYALRSWQQKEADGKTNRSLTSGEYELLLLLSDSHPTLKVSARVK